MNMMQQQAGGSDYLRNLSAKAAAEPAGSDVERLRASGAQMLERAQVALQAAQQAYVIDQAKLQAEQSRKLDELSTALREERRRFELERQRELADLSNKLQLLMEVRELFEDGGR